MQESNSETKKQMLSQLMDGEWYELNPSDCVAAMCDDEQLRAKWARYHMIRDAMHNEPMQADQSLVSRICDAIDDEPAYSNISSLSSAALPASQTRLSQSVAAEFPAIDSESEPGNSALIPAATVKRPSWVNTGVAGLALAASVALVTVVSMNLVNPQSPSDVSALAVASSVEDSAEDSVENNTAVADSGALNQLGVFESGDRSVLPTVDFVSNAGASWSSPASPERVLDEVRLNKLLSQHLEQAPTSAREGLLPYSRILGYENNNQ